MSVQSSFESKWNSFRIAAWLGWQIESNWADPFLFAIYSIVKPLSGAAILVVMYSVITNGDFIDPMFTYMYLGNAFFIYVTHLMNGIVWSVIDDREHYKTLKFIYTAPIHFPTYLLGRSVAHFLIASIAVLITLAVGVFFLQVQISLETINWLLFLISLVVGVNMLALLGMVLASFMLLMVHHMWELGAAVAGSLFLFCGAIFPIDILPPALRIVGYVLPITYWLELIRRSLIGEVANVYPTFSNLSNLQILLILIGLTILMAIIAFVTFRQCDRSARDRGLIDVVTNY